MDVNKWLSRIAMTCGIGALACTPAISMAAAGPSSCVAPASSSECCTSDAPQAAKMLEDMRGDAERVAYRAEVLVNFNNDQEADWAMNVHQLRRIKAKVDDMGKQLCKLQELEPGLPAADQDAIRQAAPLVQYMADNTTDAINYLNRHQGALWAPTYKLYTQNLDNEATALSQRIRNDEHALNVSERAGYYQKNLGMLEVFGK